MCIRRTRTADADACNVARVSCNAAGVYFVMLQVFPVMLHVFRVMLHVFLVMLQVFCNVAGVSCNVARVSCNVVRVSCNITGNTWAVRVTVSQTERQTREQNDQWKFKLDFSDSAVRQHRDCGLGQIDVCIEDYKCQRGVEEQCRIQLFVR